ncbi:MAG: septation protein IspZ [Pseudomonadota bacterium]
MDKRLVIEFVPGIAFLIGNALGGLFTGAGFACAATIIAILLRWRWDRRLPWMAIAICALTLVLVGAAFVFDDETFIKVSATVGSVAFAAIIAAGMLVRPSLLERTLGYKLQMTAEGWIALHASWIAISLARAGVNEAIWRNVANDVWAIYNGLSDFGWFAVFFGATWLCADRYWNGPD